MGVELLAHDPRWAEYGQRESARLREAIGPTLVTIHHIGSTAIPDICAKPIIDLLPVVSSLDRLDARK